MNVNLEKINDTAGKLIVNVEEGRLQAESSR